MYYCGYSNCDLANGHGARVTLFVSGCEKHCKNCFSPSSWNRYAGNPFDEDMKTKLFKDLSNSYIEGLSLLGGDPLESYNIEEVTNLCKEIKDKFPTKTIWLWTGLKKEKVEPMEICKYLDIVISEPYIDHLNFKGKYMGSKNQKIWWAKNGEPYLDEGDMLNEHASKDYVEKV